MMNYGEGYAYKLDDKLFRSLPTDHLPAISGSKYVEVILCDCCNTNFRKICGNNNIKSVDDAWKKLFGPSHRPFVFR
jgi:hypothetical protein